MSSYRDPPGYSPRPITTGSVLPVGNATPAPSGWVCPQCRAVMAPFMPHCSVCIRGASTTTTTNTKEA